MSKGKFLLFFLLAFLIAASACPAGRSIFASETNGTIDAVNKYAWGENLGWINFHPDNGGLTITDSAITGYAWSKSYGWINFSPAGGGVTNNSNGTLGGYAWSSQKGWINMSGASINTSGKFTGVAGTQGSSAGRINFNCDNCNVTTDWRPVSARTTITPPSSGGGGGGGTGMLFVSGPGGQAVPAHIDAFNVPMKLFPAQSGTLTQNLTNQKSVILDTPNNVYSDDITFIIGEETISPTISTKVSIIGNALFSVTARDEANNPVHTFLKPIKITLNVPELLRGRSDLGVYFFDDAAKVWVKIPDAIFGENNVSFYVSHLTLFAIFSATELPPAIESPFPLPRVEIQPSQEKTSMPEVTPALPAGESKEAPPLFDIEVGPGPATSKKDITYYIIAAIGIVAAGIVIYIIRRRKSAQTRR